MNIITKCTTKKITLDEALATVTEGFCKQKAAIEEELWKHVVATYPDDLKKWIQKHLFESLMILSKDDAIKADTYASTWLFEDYEDGAFCRVEDLSHCKYAQTALDLNLAEKYGPDLIKVGANYKERSFEMLITVADNQRLVFVAYDPYVSDDDSRAEMKRGTKPLVDFIRSVVDPTLEK